MNILKDKKKITPEYIAKLKKYIVKNQAVYFSKENEADSFTDFESFPAKKTDRTHLCLPTEPMLIDRSYEGVHTYCVCTISAKRKITMEIPVVRVSELENGSWRNGYFLLPRL
jgi:hypothetical protein|tara:strand:- start:3035 stop:3373 length:339 start_codon:yes stop_codon:yes gene_type:complete